MTGSEINTLINIRHDLLTALKAKDILAAKFEVNNIDTFISKSTPNSNKNREEAMLNGMLRDFALITLGFKLTDDITVEEVHKRIREFKINSLV